MTTGTLPLDFGRGVCNTISMEKTQNLIDSHTWSVIAHNAILAYTEDEPDEDVWVNVANELDLAYQRDGSISYATLCTTGKLINPDITEDEEQLGQFAWILDEAVDYFTK